MYCNCMCHLFDMNGLPLMVHCFPCCEMCDICGANIRRGYMERHKEQHEEFPGLGDTRTIVSRILELHKIESDDLIAKVKYPRIASYTLDGM